MENITANYKDLLVMYDTASELFSRTGSARLLGYTLLELEKFERAYANNYGLNALYELQIELGESGYAIV